MDSRTDPNYRKASLLEFKVQSYSDEKGTLKVLKIKFFLEIKSLPSKKRQV